MSAPGWLEFVKIVALVICVWFGLIGWTLFRQIGESEAPAEP